MSCFGSQFLFFKSYRPYCLFLVYFFLLFFDIFWFCSCFLFYFVLLCFLRQGLTLQPQLAWNSTTQTIWPQIHGHLSTSASLVLELKAVSSCQLKACIMMLSYRFILSLICPSSIAIYLNPLIYLFRDRVSLCSLTCPGTYSVDKTSLDFKDPSASVPEC